MKTFSSECTQRRARQPKLNEFWRALCHHKWKMLMSRKRGLFWTVAVTLAFFLFIYIPKPSWLSCSPYEYELLPNNFLDSPRRNSEKPKKTHVPAVIDPHARGVIRMFHIYNETLSEIDESLQKLKRDRKELDEMLERPTAKLKILPSTISRLPSHLYPLRAANLANNQTRINGTSHQAPQPSPHNIPLSNKGPTALPSKTLLPLHRQPPATNNTASSNSAQTPECVDFVGPPEMKSPKICIHPPEVDRVISMFLRDVGHWEIDKISDMEWALLAYPDMQLVDLGCNLGAFTLFAAGMGRHVVAVDVLPSNLDLLRTSLTLNDIENNAYVVRMNVKEMYPPRTKENIVAAKDRRATTETPEQTQTEAPDPQRAQIKENQPGDDNLDNLLDDLGFDMKDIFANDRKHRLPEDNFQDSFNRKRQTRGKPGSRRKSRSKFGRRLQQVGQLGQNYDSKDAYFDAKESNADSNAHPSATVMKKYATNEIRTDNKRSKSSNISRHDDVKGNNSSGKNNMTKTYSISQLVTILHNAVYNDRTSQLGVYVKPDGNIGGTEVLNADSPLLDAQRESQQLILVDSICLDDLLPLIQAPSVFLKMDVEGSESRVLECGQKFFETVHVRYVFMEWLYQLSPRKDQESAAPFMIRFLMAKGFIPTTKMGVDVKGGVAYDRGVTVLDVSQWDRWPDMVLWMER